MILLIARLRTRLATGIPKIVPSEQGMLCLLNVTEKSECQDGAAGIRQRSSLSLCVSLCPGLVFLMSTSHGEQVSSFCASRWRKRGSFMGNMQTDVLLK